MSVFETLNRINVNGHTEKKKTGSAELTYLSWPWAFAEVKKRYPDFSYEVVKFDGLPYVYDPMTGYMVYTRVTIDGVTHEMWLPVMDGANKAMKAEPYEYVTGYGQYQKKKTCEAATMFDINKTIMRCLVKNLAVFGLGLYIYAGEDLPNAEQDEKEFAIAEEVADEKKRETLRAEKIGEARAVPLFKHLEEHGVAIPIVLEEYGVNELAELTEEAMYDINKNTDLFTVATICRKNDINLRWRELKPAQAKKILADVPAFLAQAKERTK